MREQRNGRAVARTVFSVAQKGIAARRKLNTDLMRSACLQSNAYLRQLTEFIMYKGTKHLIREDGFLYTAARTVYHEGLVFRAVVEQKIAPLTACVRGNAVYYGKIFLIKDSAKGKSFVVKSERKGAKLARLAYEVLDTKETEQGALSLVKVRLFTGRTHQIRVQFASRGMPLVGDGKYGSRIKSENIGLWSHKIEINADVGVKNPVFEFAPEGNSRFDIFEEQL